MELKVYSMKKEEKGKIMLPVQFSEPLREDLIKLGVLAIQANTRQAYGADPEAGKKSVAKLSRRRHKYKSSYGIGISRVPRKIVSRRGTRFNWIGAFAPGTVGGRRAHPPKASKIWNKKMNDKERRMALRSAMAATLDRDLVAARGHNVPKDYPFCVESALEGVKKTKEVVTTLNLLGFDAELKRCDSKNIRSGRGKMRGRKYKQKKGVLLVVSEPCNLVKAAKNIPGVEVVGFDQVNLNLLAPGAQVGRLTLFTDSAIKAVEKTKFATGIRVE